MACICILFTRMVATILDGSSYNPLQAELIFELELQCDSGVWLCDESLLTLNVPLLSALLCPTPQHLGTCTRPLLQLGRKVDLLKVSLPARVRIDALSLAVRADAGSPAFAIVQAAKASLSRH